MTVVRDISARATAVGLLCPKSRAVTGHEARSLVQGPDDREEVRKSLSLTSTRKTTTPRVNDTIYLDDSGRSL